MEQKERNLGDLTMRLNNARAAFLGFHGFRSTGDDALASAIGWWLYDNRGVRRFIIPAERRDLPILPKPLEVSTPLPWLNRSRFRRDWRWHLAVKRSKIVLLAGGANLHERIDYQHFLKLVRLAKKSGSLVFGALGVSMGPFETQKKIDECGEFLAAIDFLTVRDHASYEMACQYSLPYKPVDAMDAVLTLPGVYGVSTEPKTALKSDVLDIGISVSPYKPIAGKGTAGDRISAIADAMIGFSKQHNIRVNLFEFSGYATGGDRQLIDELSSALEGKCEVAIQSYNLDPSVIWKKVADMDIMICTRFHASVFSYAAGVPFVMLDYHPKCAAFAEDIGLPEELRLDVYSLQPQDLIDSLELLIDPNRPRPTLPYAEALERANLNFEPLQELL